MIGQDSAEGSFNLISTSKELLHPDLLWNNAQSMIISLKRIFDTLCTMFNVSNENKTLWAETRCKSDCSDM